MNFEEIIRALNHTGYQGPLSVEWEDIGMDREHGAREACEFAKKLISNPRAGPLTPHSATDGRGPAAPALYLKVKAERLLDLCIYALRAIAVGWVHWGGSRGPVKAIDGQNLRCQRA